MSKQTVKAISTFTFLAAVVALAGAYIFSWGTYFAPLASADDPLTNRLQIVEPPALALNKANVAAQAAANSDSPAELKNWIYTDGGSSQNR